MPVRFGAIYFPAAAGQQRANFQWYWNNELSYGPYQTRAPWFSQQLSAHTLYINATQADIDQDCVYAANGGIKWWAYQGVTGDPADTLKTEFNLYQTSPNRNLVNWCINDGYAQLVITDPMFYVNYFKQTNYEKVLGDRPLLLYNGKAPDPPAAAAAITALRAACAANSVGDPYVLTMDFLPADAAATHDAVGANAITTYARAFGGQARFPFASFIADQQNQWEAFKATGKQMVPNLTAGWNLNPIHGRGEPNSSYARGGVEAALYDRVEIATPANLVTLANAAKTFIAANAAQCPANIALYYAWSEHTEGGYIRPTWSASGPNTSRLDALAPVHNS